MTDLKREYVLIRRGQDYYYARLVQHDPDMYVIQASVSEKEGRDIIERANAGSDYNKQQQELSQPQEQDNGRTVSESTSGTAKRVKSRKRNEPDV